MKLTPIYPAHIKPVRKGVYKVSIEAKGELTGWAYWDGRLWGWLRTTQARANMFRTGCVGMTSQNKRWQGLATKDGK